MRSTTTREPEWDDEERAKVLALLDYEGMQCPGCGGHLPETTDPDSSYTTDLPHRCFRCDAIQKQQEKYKDTKRPSALALWPAYRKDS